MMESVSMVGSEEIGYKSLTKQYDKCFSDVFRKYRVYLNILESLANQGKSFRRKMTSWLRHKG